MNDRIKDIVNKLTNLSTETEWVEFKQSVDDPEKIGKNISALSNSAALVGKDFGYIVWGIEDGTHNIVGTNFLPKKKKIGNEDLEGWLLQRLSPRLDVKILDGEMDGVQVVIFEIPAAQNKPVQFSNIDYIRIGSYTKKLHDYPEKERALWRIFEEITFETGLSKKGVASDDILTLIDYPSFFVLLKLPLPENRAAILERLISERVISPVIGDKYNVTNLGAILFARELSKFDRLSRKALRIIIYRGQNRIETEREFCLNKGYAVGFEEAIAYIDNHLPQNEEIKEALRKEIRVYPRIAIRELVANALIHQDFSITGAGPMVEIFSNRIEVSNPGTPLINPLRFIDESPRSRNEILAALMRRMNICEERGSGIDKVVSNIEALRLPALGIRATEHSTITILYGPKDFSAMNREERIQACYQHAVLQYVSHSYLTNASLRERLNIEERNYPIASRIIRDAIESKLVKLAVTNTVSKKSARYEPIFA